MKIQVIKKATPRPAVDAVCPWFLDCNGTGQEVAFSL